MCNLIKGGILDNMFKTESIWEFKIAGRIKFGLGAVEELSSDLKTFPGDKVIIITDQGVKKAGILDYVKDIIKDYNCSVFDQVSSDPDLKNVESALTFAKENNCNIIIGLGGGSSVDVAKVVATIAKYGGDIRDYIAPPNGKGKPIEGPGFPMVAIPTTSGTGSEVSPAAVITLTDKELKVGISSQMQRPALAVVDPLLTISVPPHVTAYTGIDALCHAIEGYATKRFDQKEKPTTPEARPIYGGTTIFTDIFAEKAIELVAKNLRQAFNNGKDVMARSNLSLASLMAGISFTNAGLGVVHAMSFPLGGKFHIPHGIAIAATLPAVMVFNATSNYDIFKKIAVLMGENIEGLSDRDAALKSAKAVKELCRDVGIPNISTYGITKDDLPTMASETMKIQRLLAGNPRMVSVEDALNIFQNAIEG